MTGRIDTAAALQARLRLRELAQYYSATSSLPDADFNPSKDADGKIRPYDLANFQPYTPDLSTDPILTAFAQLAAIRLDCHRSFISLIGESAQHVVAEATKTISPFDKDDFEGDDGIVLGAQSIPLTFGICTTTIGVFTGKCEHSFGAGTDVQDGYICISDLRAEDQTSALPALQALPPILRFYLEVPLFSKAGFVIGSICVMDTVVKKAKPRDVKILQEVSRLVMRHLELTRMREDHRKAERLLEGLGHFLKGRNSIKDRGRHTVRSDSSSHQTDFFAPASLRDEQKATALEGQTIQPSTLPDDRLQHTTAADTLVAQDDEALATSSTGTPVHKRKKTATFEESRPDGLDDVIDSDSVIDELQAEEIDPDPGVLSIRQTFSRAANLICESMDLDACCFLDIPHAERYKRAGRRKGSTQPYINASDASVRSQSSCDSTGDSDADGTMNGLNIRAIVTTPVALCDRLGFSTRVKNGVTDTAVAGSHLTIPTSLMVKLSSRYPRGRIFHFDTIGSVSSGSDEHKDDYSEISSRYDRRGLSARLLACFPTARSLIFYPMYNNEKQEVYAAYLGYTTNSARGLQKSELTYISGFANSIMCEVMRLEAEATDKAKSDFISSISHELRSPLHGILASSQLISESTVLPKQVEFLEMIETCARTLLDTMNHLLDHAKINHFTGQQDPATPKPRTQRMGSRSSALTTDLDLLAVVEETTASMAASSDRKAWRLETGEGALPTSTSSGSEDVQKSVPLILTVTPRKRWTFKSEPGSWRRIIMNLVGNSLKYTQKGHVNVILAVRDSPKAPNLKLIELRVRDTGQGISAKYLKHKLYTPFAQENNLSVGTGLGLSLVHKIVSSLSGDIQIKSEVGAGTEVLITIPLEQNDNDLHEIESGAAHGVPDLKGVVYKLVGFDTSDASSELVNGYESSRTKALRTLRKSLDVTLLDIFGEGSTESDAGIILIEEAFLERELEAYDIASNYLFVVGLDGRSHTTGRLKHAKFVYVLPPVGPRRMAQALKTLLAMKTEAGNGDDSAMASLKSDIPKPNTIADPPIFTPVGVTFIESNLTNLALHRPPQNSEQPRLENSPIFRNNFTPDAGQTESKLQGKKAVLLVDDNSINLRILTAIVSRLNLQAKGIETITAADGLEALNKYTAATQAGTKVLIVFMDISMPVMDGFEATREIRAFEDSTGVGAEARTPIIAVTGLGSAVAQKEIENSGFDLYLRKPVGIKAVREVIAKYIVETA